MPVTIFVVISYYLVYLRLFGLFVVISRYIGLFENRLLYLPLRKCYTLFHL